MSLVVEHHCRKLLRVVISILCFSVILLAASSCAIAPKTFSTAVDELDSKVAYFEWEGETFSVDEGFGADIWHELTHRLYFPHSGKYPSVQSQLFHAHLLQGRKPPRFASAEEIPLIEKTFRALRFELE